MEEKKGLKILTARNGVALVAVLAILLILTLLIPVMFTMGESSVKSSVLGIYKQKSYYLSRSGVEMGVAYMKDMLYSYENILDLVGRDKDTNVILYDKVDPNNSSKTLIASTYTDATERAEKIECTKFIEEFRKMYKTGSTAIDSNSNYIDASADAKYGITREASKNDTYVATAKMQRMWYYIDETNDANYKYISSTSTQPQQITENNIHYVLVGYVDVTVTYSGEPHYYDANNNEITYSTAYEKNPNKSNVYELKAGYKKIQNDIYTVKAVSSLSDRELHTTLTAAVVQTKQLGSAGAGEGIVQYTGNTYGESPEFYLDMCEIPYEYKNNVLTVSLTKRNDSTANGGNLCMADPTEANAKQNVSFVKTGDVDDSSASLKYENRYLYVYSAIGNMNISCSGTGSEGNELVLGVYPGLAWKKDNKPSCNVLKTFNYYSWSDTVQYENFVAYAATNTLEVNMGIDVRVNPTRAGRAGDVNLLGSSANANLFKMIILQGKDIVIDGRVDLMFSFFYPKNKNFYMSNQSENTGKRAGSVILSAPSGTPYSYYNTTRKTQVPAGMVYFQKDVYLWLIPYDEDGSPSGYTKLSETIYKTGTISSTGFSKKTYSDNFKGNTYTYTIEKTNAGDFEVYRLFKAGDVYYFNSGIAQQVKDASEDQEVGLDMVNWFIETCYLKRKTDGTLKTFFKNFKQNLYCRLFNSAAWDSNNPTYAYDDMHYVGNIKEVSNIEIPSTENQVYVIWS